MGAEMNFTPLPVNNDAFSVIDTHQKAYLLGFLLADGCVLEARPGRYRARINLKILAKDIHVCRMAQDVAGGCLRLVEDGYRAIWEVNSDEMAANLIALGITPRKTFTAALKWDDIPVHMHGTVLAGLIDGDGNLRFDDEKRRVEVSIATASAPLRDQLLGRFPFFKCVEVPPKGTRKSTLYRVEVQNNRSRLNALLSLVYDTLPFHALARKQTVVDQIRSYLSAQDDYEDRMGQVAVLKLQGLTVGQIADRMGTSQRPVRERLQAQGIDCRRVVFDECDRARILRLHRDGLSVLEIHARFGKGTEQAVRYHLHKMGALKKADCSERAPHPKTGEITEAYKAGKPAYRIAQELGMDARVVCRVLRAAGVQPTKGSPVKLSALQVEWAASQLSGGRTLKSIAEELGVSATLVRLRHRELMQRSAEESADGGALTTTADTSLRGQTE